MLATFINKKWIFCNIYKNISYYFIGRPVFFYSFKWCHVAIVGTDGNIYHSYPNDDGRRKDTLTSYINLFSKGDKFEVFRPKDTNTFDPDKAAQFAEAIYNLIETYNPLNINLNDFNENYCSKFVWQAYYYSSWEDITDQDYDHYTQTIVLPSEIEQSSLLKSVATFTK